MHVYCNSHCLVTYLIKDLTWASIYIQYTCHIL